MNLPNFINCKYNLNNNYSEGALLTLSEHCVFSPDRKTVLHQSAGQNAYLALITSGSGTISCQSSFQSPDNKAIAASSDATSDTITKECHLGTLFYIGPSCSFQLSALSEHWGFELCVISGHPLCSFQKLVGDLVLIDRKKVTEELLNRWGEICILAPPTSLFEEWNANHILADLLFQLLVIHQDHIHGTPVPSYIKEIKEYMEEHFASHITLTTLERTWGISRYRLCREFTTYYDLSPIKYLNELRLYRATRLLCTTKLHINEVAQNIGMENVNNFIRLFKLQYGTTPQQYRKERIPIR